MNPGIAANQQRLFLAFVAELRPHVRRDSALPRRIKELLARQRAIGSRDRKLYRELIYTWLRFLPWCDPLWDEDLACRAAAGRQASSPGPATSAGPTTGLFARTVAWLAPELKPTAHYRAALCADWPAVPETLAAKSEVLRFQVPGFRSPPEALLPDWFRSHCPAAFEPPHLDAINTRANVWVRLQCNDRNIVLDEFRSKQWTWETAADFPDALCLPPNAEVANTDAYRRGFIEIQDLGSQLVLATAPIPPGGRWLDACAGAGGKTLQLARLLGDAGHVDATDIRPEILEELRDRAQRARLTNVRITNIPEPAYDGVLVDAPCSGSGTWRRQPHLKWYVKPESIASFAKTQLEILTAHATRVKPGGLLIYATCSLSHVENQDVVAAFLQAHADFNPLPAADTHGGTFDGFGTTLLPGTRNTDGFYAATLRRA